MSLISTIKSILGMGDSKRAEDGTTVTVEREPGGSAGGAVERTAPASADEPDAGDVDEADDAEESGVDEVPSDAADEPEEPGGAGEPVDSISGIGPAYAERLADAGIETVDDLAAADAAEVAEETDIAEARVRGWIEQAGSS